MSNGVTARKPAFFNQPVKQQNILGDIVGGAIDVVGTVAGGAKKIASYPADWISNATDFILPEAVEDVFGDIRRQYYGGIFKPLAQGAFAGINTFQQLATNSILFAVNQTGFPGVEKNQDYSTIQQIGNIFRATDYGTIIETAIKAAQDPNKSYSYEDLFGGGFFIEGMARENLEEKAMEYRPKTEGGAPLTIGSLTLSIPDQLGIVEEGTKPYQIISGGVDMVSMLALDPTFSFQDLTRLPGQVKGLYRGAKDMTTAAAYKLQDLRNIAPPMTKKMKDFWYGKFDSWAARRGVEFIEGTNWDGTPIRVRKAEASVTAQQASDEVQRLVTSIDEHLVVVNDLEFRQTQLAPEVQAAARAIGRQEGAMFHGSKMIDIGDFVAIDDPRFPGQQGNLFGPGLYVSDNTGVVTSPGYFGEEGIQKLMPTTALEEMGFILPEGISTSFFPVAKEGAEARGSVTRLRWKEGYEPKILNGDAPLPREVAEAIIEEFNLPNIDFDLYEQVKNIWPANRFAENEFLALFNDADPLSFLLGDQAWSYKQLRSSLASLYDRVFTDSVRVPYPAIQGFGGIRGGIGGAGDKAEMLGRILKANPDTLTPEEIGEISMMFENAVMPFDEEGQLRYLKTMNERIQYIKDRPELLQATREDYRITQKFATEILGISLADDATTVGNAYFDATVQKFVATLKPNAFRNGAGRTIDEFAYQAKIRDLGYDAIEYQGGQRIGGYGDHTARAIINYDNLEVADVLTGERHPVNDALNTMRQNEAISDTVAQLRGDIDDFYTALNNQQKIVQDEIGMSNAKSPGRRTIVPSVWEANRDTPRMAKMFEAIAKEDDAATIWRIYLRGSAPGLALELSKAKTADEVKALFDDAVKTLDPNRHIYRLPAGTYNGVSELGFTVKQASSRYTRQFQTLPENLFLPFDDPVRGVKRFDDLAGVLNMSLADRNKWTARLMAMYQNGDETGAFFEFAVDFAKEVMKPALKAAGFTPSEIANATKFKSGLADVSTWSLADLANDPASWMIRGQEGPLRTTQLMSQGMYLFNVASLPDIVQATGTIGRVARRMEGVPIAGKAFKGTRMFKRVLQAYSSEIWKPSVVIGIKHMFKVIPDEIMRTLLTGTFESPAQYLAAVQMRLFDKGGYVADVFGQTFDLARQIGDLELEVNSLREVTEQIAKLRKAGKLDQAAEMLAMYSDDLAEYTNKIDELAKLQAKFDSDLPKFTDAMIGQIPDKAIATGTNSVLVGDDIRHGLTNIINKDDIRYRDQYIAGVSHQTGDMYNNPIFRRVANGKPFDDDIISLPEFDRFGAPVMVTAADGTQTQSIIKATYAEHLASGRVSADGTKAIEEWILNGEGKRYYQDYLKRFGRKAPGFSADAPEGVAAYVRLAGQEIAKNIGTNAENLQVLATGMFDGQPAFFRESTGRWVPAPAYEEFLSSAYVEAADSTNQVLYHSKLMLDENPLISAVEPVWKGWKYLVGKYFQGMYGQTSDKLARSPLWRGAYWDAVESTLSVASQEAVDALRANLATAQLPKVKVKRIQFMLNQAEVRIAQGLTVGGEDLEAITKFAEAYATDKTIGTLYDASKRSLFGYQHQLLFPFFEAFREQAQTYAKIIAQRPEVAYWGAAGVKGLQRATAIGPGDIDNDGQPEGFLYTNEFGNEVFGIPMTGAIAKFLTGTPTANFEVGARQMSMIGQVVPGVGFVAQIPLSYFSKLNEPEMSLIADIVFPMGRPEDRGTIMSSLDPRPLWARRMSPLVTQGLEKIPGIGRALSDFTKVIFGNQESTVDYKQYYNKVLQSYATTIATIKSDAEMSALLKEVETKTNIIYFMRGLTQAVIGSPTTVFMAETKQGDIRMGYLADKLREYEDAAEENGLSRYQGTAQFLSEYGANLWSLFGDITKSKIPGLQPTEEYDRWASKNKDFLDTYPEVGGYFGPTTGDFSPSAYSRQKYRGMRESSDPRQMLIDAQNQMGYTLLNLAKSRYSVDYLQTDEGKTTLRQVKDQVKELFPFWDGKYGWVESAKRREKQISQLEEIANSDFVQQSEMGKMVRVYMGMREWYVSEYQASNPGSDWTKNQNGQYVREQLTRVGDDLARMVPAFAFLWQNVLAPEFVTDLED